ncbi:MAG: hypothetical protein JWL84_5091 [Rhodospirillales bacterium]|nr:hypothetical protein [Rhodospirillales bacterium]
MSTKLRNLQVAVGLGIAFTAFSLTAHAAPSVQASDHEEQRAIDDIARGDDALSSGHRHAAIVAIERAQTTLLNAEQAQTYSAPQAIAALDQAHAEVVKGQLKAAATTLHSAENDLKTPKVG